MSEDQVSPATPSIAPEDADELERLIREQEQDDTDYQEPQRFGDNRALSYNSSLVTEDFVVGSSADDPQEAYSGPVEPENGQMLVALRTLVLKALEGFPESWSETYWLVYGERCSMREAARRQGLSDHKTVAYRLMRIRQEVQRLIAEQEGWL